jgi:hypothetical protein
LTPKNLPDTPKHLVPSATNLTYLKMFDQSLPLAMDLETRGTQAAYLFLDDNHPQKCRIQQVGLSDGVSAVTFDRRALSESEWIDLWIWLEGCSYLFGHNVMFDASFSYAECLIQRKDEWASWTRLPKSTYLNWKSCSYLLFKLLAGEGYAGQQWGLKAAQKELLGWRSTNEKELDEWLVTHGYFVGSLHADMDHKHGRLLAYNTFNKRGGRKIRPNKAEMHQAPPHILGHYCALDAYSTYLLHEEILVPALAQFNERAQERIGEHVGEWMTLIRLHVSQQLSGIFVDRDQLFSYQEVLSLKIEDKRKEFFEHPSVMEHIKLFQEMELDVIREAEPPQYKKLKVPESKPEPDKLTKAGKPSKNWDKWVERQELIADMLDNPSKHQEINGNWTRWKEKFEKNEKVWHFNPGSSLHLEWLYYEWLEFPCRVKTKSDGRATDEKAKLGWGPSGRLLIEIDQMEKELTYVRAALFESEADGIAHVRMKAPGTVTLRLAGGSMKKNKKEPNLSLHQQPKSRPYLECFKSRPGRVIVQSDFAALENVVLAEVTRDPAMLTLYGPNSLKTDAYIWNGSQLPVLGEKFREAGYDPKNPSQESVSLIKKTLKLERGIAKKVSLGKNYGMGAGKLRADLELEGIEMSKEEAYAIIDGLNTLYKVAYLDYPSYLEEEWLTNRGYVLNCLGLPCSVDNSKKKDLVNRVTQSSGHQITVKSLAIMEEVLEEKGFHMMWWPGAEKHKEFVAPWIADFHDEHMLEAAVEVKDIIKDSYEERLRRLNEWLDGYVKLEADPEIGMDLAHFKCEE